MKALVQHGYGGAEVLRLEDRPILDPGPGQMRLRVLACGVNGSDWEYIRGIPLYARYAGGSPRGRVLGSDICGFVEEMGSGVTGFKMGQTVAAETLGTFGGFAEFALVPAERCLAVPDGMDVIEVAALPQSGAVAVCGVGDLVQAGHKVLVNGAGGAAGPLAVQLAVHAGADVTAIDCAAKLNLLHELGVNRVLDYHAVDFAAEPVRYDLILDLWGTRPVRAVRRCLNPGGTYYLVGGPMNRIIAFASLGTLLGLLTSRKSTLLLAELGVERTPQVFELAARGTIRPVVSAVVPLEEAAGALARMGAGELPGKLVIQP